MTDYEAGKARLIRAVRRQVEPWNPAAYRRQLREMAERLDKLWSDLWDPQWVGLEEAYDTGGEVGRATFSQLLLGIRELADAAGSEAADLPMPQARPATRMAAEGLVALRKWHGLPKPRLYAGGEDVAELAAICEAAGVPRDNETLRGVLASALKQVDNRPCPPWIRYVINGRIV